MTFKKWQEKFKRKPLKYGECNCTDCRSISNSRNTLIDALKDLTHFKEIPRMYTLDHLKIFKPLMRYGAPPFDNSKYWEWVLTALYSTYQRNIDNKFKVRKHRLCADCGRMYLKGRGRIVAPGVHVCPDCWGRFYIKCGKCKGIHGRADAWGYNPQFDTAAWNHGGRRDDYVCHNCYTEHFISCQGCNMLVDEHHWKDASSLFGSDTQMRRWFDKTGGLQMKNMPAVVFCPTCYNENVRACGLCGEDTYIGHTHRHEHRGQLIQICSSCVEKRKVIKRYDYSVKPKFLTSRWEIPRKTGLHYGVEIEMEHPLSMQSGEPLDEKGRKMLDWWGGDEFYIKHDGSLDHGFELVSHPFTYSHFLDNKNKWIDFLIFIKELGFDAEYRSPNKGRNTCGFHVHMSKSAFSSLHLYKFINLFYKRSLRAFIVGIAGRTSSDFARFNIKDADNIVKMSKDKLNVSRKRYSVINLMGGHAHENGRAHKDCQTVEVRMFKGTLDPFIFTKNIEFLQSAFEFTSYNAMKDIVVRKYLEHIMLKPDNWRSLISYIKGDPKINGSYTYIPSMTKGV